MAYEAPLIRSVLGNNVVIAHPVIPEDIVTFLTASVSAGATALSVVDNYPLTQNDFVLLGDFGIERSEIVRITGAVTQGTALTTGAVIYDHSFDTMLSKVLWDQVEVSGANSISGSKTVIATINLQPDREESNYTVTGTTYGYYFARFKNSYSTIFSEYSDPATATGYSDSTVRAAKDTALEMINEKVSTLLNNAFLNRELFNCEKETWAEKKQWGWATSFETILSDTSTGQLSVATPTNIADSQSNKSILMLRIGTRPNLVYLTKSEWDRRMQDQVRTTLASDLSAIATSMVLTDSSDFDDSGTVTIGAENYAFSANNRSTNTLTITAGSAQTAGVDVWQNPGFAEPTGYTVFGGRIYFDRGIPSDLASQNIVLSFYSKPTAINSDSDTLNIPDYTVYHYYLAWKCLLKKNNGKKTDEARSMFAHYRDRVKFLKNNDSTGQRTVIKPRLNGDYRGSRTSGTFISTARQV